MKPGFEIRYSGFDGVAYRTPTVRHPFGTSDQSPIPNPQSPLS